MAYHKADTFPERTMRSFQGLLLFVLVGLFIFHMFSAGGQDGLFKATRAKNNFGCILTPLPHDLRELNEMCAIVQRVFSDWVVIMYGETVVKSLIFDGIEDHCHVEILPTPSPRGLADGRSKALHLARNANIKHLYVVRNLTRFRNVTEHRFILGDNYFGPIYTGTEVGPDLDVHFGCNGNHIGHTEKAMALGHKLCHGPPPVLQGMFPTKWVDNCQEAIPIAVAGQPLRCTLDDALYSQEIFWAIPLDDNTDAAQLNMWHNFVMLLLAEKNDLVRIIGVAERRERAARDSTSDYLHALEIKTLSSILKQREEQSSGEGIIQSGRSNTEILPTLDLYSIVQHYFQNPAIHQYMNSSWIDTQLNWVKSFNHQFKKADNVSYECTNKINVRPWRRKDANGGLEQQKRDYDRVCPSLVRNSSVNMDKPWVQYNGIALVITYNNIYDEVMFLVEMLYRPFFPIMLHCTPKLRDAYEGRKEHLWRYNWMEYNNTMYISGGFNYECIVLVYSLKLPVNGYIFMSDDVIMGIPDFPSLPNDYPWIGTRVWTCPCANNVTVGEDKLWRGLDVSFCLNWVHYKRTTPYAVKALQGMKALQNVNPVYERCIKTLKEIFGSNSSDIEHYILAFSDLYYIPAEMMGDAAELVNLFIKHGVVMEIAVPLTLLCVKGERRLVGQRIAAVESYKVRQKMLKVIPYLLQGQHSAIHPIKWSYLLNGNIAYNHMICNNLIPFLHNSSKSTKSFKWINLPGNSL